MSRTVPPNTTLVIGLLFASTLALMLTMLGSSSERGISAPPAQAASIVKVTVHCSSNPETTRVANLSSHGITIRKVGSIYQPRSNEPFTVSRRLGVGKAIIFESGYAANSNVLTKQYIYSNDVGSKEGARVGTSVGRFVDRCG